MSELKNFGEYLEEFDWQPVAVDKSHAVLLFGLITSFKPREILEIGIGSGFITKTILKALNYNQYGNLTSIDNWHDWNGNEPDHAKELKDLGCNIIAPIDEKKFVDGNKNKYDVIIVDGNHNQGGNWAHKVLEFLNPEGFLFAHDVEMKRYPTLKNYSKVANEKGYYNFTFNKSSRKEEMCERGWIMIQNRK